MARAKRPPRRPLAAPSRRAPAAPPSAPSSWTSTASSSTPRRRSTTPGARPSRAGARSCPSRSGSTPSAPSVASIPARGSRSFWARRWTATPWSTKCAAPTSRPARPRPCCPAWWACWRTRAASAWDRGGQLGHPWLGARLAGQARHPGPLRRRVRARGRAAGEAGPRPLPARGRASGGRAPRLYRLRGLARTASAPLARRACAAWPCPTTSPGPSPSASPTSSFTRLRMRRSWRSLGGWASPRCSGSRDGRTGPSRMVARIGEGMTR